MTKFLIILTLMFAGCAHHDGKKLSFDAELSGFEYPFEVKNFKLDSQRKTLNFRYMDVKPSKPARRTVVLLHGKNFSGYYWERLAKDLLEQGNRVIIPDQIGFGKSSKPTDYLYSFHQLGLNTIKLLDHLEVSKFVLVGHSMGGMLATHMSVNYSSRIKKLILINPIGLEDYLKYVEYKDPQFFYQSEVSKTVDQFRDYQKKNYYAGEWNETYEALLRPFKGWKSGSDWKQVAWVNALTYNPIFAEEIVSKFSQLQIPVALIIGTRDKTGPGRNWKKNGVTYQLGQYHKLGKQVKAQVKNLELFELKGLGHMPQFEDYQIFKSHFDIAFN